MTVEVKEDVPLAENLHRTVIVEQSSNSACCCATAFRNRNARAPEAKRMQKRLFSSMSSAAILKAQ
jgi:hypothetical protein